MASDDTTSVRTMLLGIQLTALGLAVSESLVWLGAIVGAIGYIGPRYQE